MVGDSLEKKQESSSPEVTNGQKRIKKKEEATLKVCQVTVAPKPYHKKSVKCSIVLIQGTPEKTYADVLERLRKEIDPDASHIRVVGVIPTNKEDLLIRIGGS